jgi:hypothetical protein
MNVRRPISLTLLYFCCAHAAALGRTAGELEEQRKDNEADSDEDDDEARTARPSATR